MNSLETRLGSWKPRRPSAKLEARIFGGANAEATASPLRIWRLEFRHAAGVAAACVALLLAVSPGGRWMGRMAAAGEGFPVLGAWSNQSCAVGLSLAYAPHNNWSAPIFSWTTEGNIPSNTRSFEFVNTNRLLH